MPASNHIFELGDLPLAGGAVLEDARIDYRVHGTPAADNIVLFPHMYSGGVASLDRFVGPGRPLDPAHVCVVVPGQLGNGVASSPSNARGRLPELSIADDVEAQRRLLDERFGAAGVRLLAGYSMGALQGYEWAVRHPERVERLLVIAGAARTGKSARALIDGLAGLLTGPDPLRAHAARWQQLGVSRAVYERRRWRSLGHDSEAEFTRAVFDDDLAGCDPRDLLCQLAKWRAADVSRNAGGDLAAALGRIRARVCVVALEDDPFATPEQCAADQSLIPGAELRLVETCWGHYAFAGFDERDTAAIDQAIRDLLAHER